MKTLILSIITLFIFACVGGPQIAIKPINPFEPPPLERPCTIYEDMQITSGLIYEKIKNPCAAQNILIVVAQSAYALEAYEIEEFQIWANRIKTIIGSGNITYTGLRALVLKEVLAINRKMGLILVSASGLIDIFEGSEIIAPDDVKLLHASLDDLVKQVQLISGF